jgi:hypothetical protein
MVVLVLVAAFGVLAGCSDPTEPEPKPEEIVNPDKPNANDRILSQVVIGDASKWTSLWEVARDNAAGYYFRGGYNSYRGGGRLSTTGTVTWHTRTTYSPRDICVTGPAASVPNALIMVGGYDTDGDDAMDIAYVSLVSSSGTLVNQLVYSSDTLDMWLTSIVPVSDSTFVAIGGSKNSAGTYPFLVMAKLAPSGQLEKQGDVIIDSLPGLYFGYAAMDPDESSESQLVVYVNSGPDVAAVHKLSLPLPALAPSTVEWTREITVPAVVKWWVNGLRFFDGNLYWVGSADDPAKDPRPSTGGYWRSGAVGSFTSAGTPRWVSLAKTTGHSDGLYSMVAAGGSLYAIGYCGSFSQQDQQLSYGWICKMAADTGTPLTHMTFGDHSYSSGLNDGIIEGNTMHCVGWTHQEVSGAYQGWFCKVNVSPTLAESPVSLPAPVHASDRAVPEDHEIGAGGSR